MYYSHAIKEIHLIFKKTKKPNWWKHFVSITAVCVLALILQVSMEKMCSIEMHSHFLYAFNANRTNSLYRVLIKEAYIKKYPLYATIYGRNSWEFKMLPWYIGCHI